MVCLIQIVRKRIACYATGSLETFIHVQLNVFQFKSVTVGTLLQSALLQSPLLIFFIVQPHSDLQNLKLKLLTASCRKAIVCCPWM